MSLSDTWAEELGDIELSMLYRTMNRAITLEKYREFLPTKGEQDVAWAIKHEYERRKAEDPEATLI
jgi:hypothetical protein